MLTTTLLYSLAGLILFVMGFFVMITHSHPLRKILAVNVMATGVFLIMVAAAYQPLDNGDVDPVPQAMVLTGIVVSVSITALALILVCRIQETSNKSFGDQRRNPKKTGT